jgi:hypothetical protein
MNARTPDDYRGTFCQSVTTSLTPAALADVEALQRVLEASSRAEVFRIALAYLAADYLHDETGQARGVQ